LRSLKVQLRPSAEACQLLARSGAGLRSLPGLVRLSKRTRLTKIDSTNALGCQGFIVGSAAMGMLTVPPAWAAPAAAAAVVGCAAAAAVGCAAAAVGCAAGGVVGLAAADEVVAWAAGAVGGAAGGAAVEQAVATRLTTNPNTAAGEADLRRRGHC